MSIVDFKLLNSLRYNVSVASPGTGVSTAFPVNTDFTSRYVAAEQAFNFSVSGLKPNTLHRVYLGTTDVTSKCKQEGGILGTGLITSTDQFITSAPSSQVPLDGTVNFTYYYQSGISPTTAFEQAGASASLLASPQVLTIASADGSSKAVAYLVAPNYAQQEPTVTVSKTPDPQSSASQTTYNQVTQTTSTTSNQTTVPVYTFSFIQTFFADADIVGGSNEVSLTSVDLYFRRKPSQTNNSSGVANPGVSILICDVENDNPVLTKTYAKSATRKAYGDIYSFSDASTPTSFVFPEPVKITTGKFYGIIITFEDPDYVLWTNKTGDYLVGTKTPSSGVNMNKDGKLFGRNNSSVYNAINDTDLKFNVKIAKYTTSSDTKTYVNKDYEFIYWTTKRGRFIAGEWVYQNTAPQAGTITINQGSRSITGLGTSFTSLYVNDLLVIESANTRQIVTIANIANNTYMTTRNVLAATNTAAKFYKTVIGRVHDQSDYHGTLHLDESTANANFSWFSGGNTIIGIDSGASCVINDLYDLPFHRFRVRGNVFYPTNGNIDTYLFPPLWNGNNFVYSTQSQIAARINDILSKSFGFKSALLSRSREIFNSSLFSNTVFGFHRKSMCIQTNYYVLGNNESWTSPTIQDSKLDVYTVENVVSNTCDITTANNVVIDTEVSGFGNALSKHITTKVSFNNNRYAEDVRMFMVAYRPIGTDIRCYARLYNSNDPEAFDDKAWTPLQYKSNANKYSSSDDSSNFIEYELGLPQFSPSANALPGTFTSSYNSESLAAQGVTPSSYVAAGDAIKIYNKLFPNDNYQVGIVSSANATHIVMGNVIESNNVAGAGFNVDRLKYNNIAFNNVNNSNIARYFDGIGGQHDTFDSMQIKIVFLADNAHKVPKIDQIQVIGVSA